MQTKVFLCEQALSEAKKTIKANKKQNAAQESKLNELEAWKLRVKFETSDLKTAVRELAKKLD